jgi:Copper chaperone
METIQLTIPSMKSQHCMMTVTQTVKAMGGASVKKVSPGTAEIELSTATKDLVVAAIEKAGYAVVNK